MFIKEGTFLGKENSEKRKRFGRRKRIRWNIQYAPESERGKWSILFEAVRLDFVYKGPDNLSSFEYEGKGRRRTADDGETRFMITQRYKQIFLERMRSHVKDTNGCGTVSFAFLTSAGHTTYKNFASSLRNYIVNPSSFDAYNLPAISVSHDGFDLR